MLIYDLEIVNAIPVKKEPRVDGIEYCKGWGDHAGMGISCLCAYDYESDRYRVFTEKNKDEFFNLTKDRLLIGFNNINFDNKVIKSAWGTEILKGQCYDILRKVWKGVGYDENIFNFNTHTGYGLDACCKANFGLEKTGWGGSAPVDWQQGKIGTVIDYCLNDIKMTKMLFDQIIKHGDIIDPKNITKKIKIGMP